MRLFAAIDLPLDTKEQLADISGKIKQSCEQGNFARYENYHITLVFLGDLERENLSGIKKIIEEASNLFPPMRLSSRDVGQFIKGNGKIVYYNVYGDTKILSELQSFMYSQFYKQKLCRKQNEYTPHITFARKVKVENLPLIKQEITFPADAITLMHSTRINGKLTYVPIYSRQFTGTFTIERIEEKITICETINGLKFNIENNFLPKGISSGSKIRYNGFSFMQDKEETQRKIEDIRKKFNKEIRKHK